MVDSRNRPGSRSVDLNVGTLIITGFTGNPQRISEAILGSEHVENVSAKRSGTQLELKVSLSHPPVTPRRLLELVQLLPEYDVKIQGELMAPVPTLIVSLTPVRTRHSKFSPRKSRLGPGQRNLSRPELPSVTPAHEIGTTSAAAAVLLRQSTRTPAPVPERDENEQPGPVAVFSKQLGRFVARSLAAGLLGAASIIGRSIRYLATHALRRTVRLAGQVKRALSRSFSATTIVMLRISAVITLIGNGIFGTGAVGDSETEPSESTDPKSNQDRQD